MTAKFQRSAFSPRNVSRSSSLPRALHTVALTEKRRQAAKASGMLRPARTRAGTDIAAGVARLTHSGQGGGAGALTVNDQSTEVSPGSCRSAE